MLQLIHIDNLPHFDRGCPVIQNPKKWRCIWDLNQKASKIIYTDGGCWIEIVGKVPKKRLNW